MIPSRPRIHGALRAMAALIDGADRAGASYLGFRLQCLSRQAIRSVREPEETREPPTVMMRDEVTRTEVLIPAALWPPRRAELIRRAGAAFDEQRGGELVVTGSAARGAAWVRTADLKRPVDVHWWPVDDGGQSAETESDPLVQLEADVLG